MSATATQVLTVSAAIEARHSIRSYTDAPVPAADLAEILRLAGLAPSAFNVQPWRFVVVRDPAVKERLKGAAYNQAQVGAAPVVIVAYSDMQDALATIEEVVHPGVPEEAKAGTVQMIKGSLGGLSPEALEAWGAQQSIFAIGYLTLAAQSLGYGTSVMAGFVPDQVKEILGLPAHVSIPALIALGVPAEPGFSAHRHPAARFIREV